MSSKPTTTDSSAERLAVRAPEAARKLGIGTRLLWSLTNQNQIPHCRIGKAILYPVDQLRAWLAEQAKGGGCR